MFDIGWSELLVVAVVAVIIVGPKDLPKLMRGISHYAGKLRSVARELQQQIETAMRDSDVEEMRHAIESVQAETPPFYLRSPIEKPVMLPKPMPAPPAEASAPGEERGSVKTSVAPKSTRKRGSAKPTNEAKPSVSGKRGKKPAEPAP